MQVQIAVFLGPPRWAFHISSEASLKRALKDFRKVIRDEENQLSLERNVSVSTNL